MAQAALRAATDVTTTVTNERTSDSQARQGNIKLPPPLPSSADDPKGFADRLALAMQKGQFDVVKRMLAQSALAAKSMTSDLRHGLDVQARKAAELQSGMDLLHAKGEDHDRRFEEQRQLNASIIASGQRLHGDVVSLTTTVSGLRSQFESFRAETLQFAHGHHNELARLANCERIRGWYEEERDAKRKTYRYVAVNGAYAAAIGAVILLITQQMGWLPAIVRFFN